MRNGYVHVCSQFARKNCMHTLIFCTYVKETLEDVFKYFFRRHHDIHDQTDFCTTTLNLTRI